MSLLNRVPCVPFNLLVPQISACPRAFNVGVPSCPRARIFGVPSCHQCWRALVPKISACLRTFDVGVPTCPRARVPKFSACPRAFNVGVPSCPCALVPLCPNFRRALLPSMLACPGARVALKRCITSDMNFHLCRLHHVACILNARYFQISSVMIRVRREKVKYGGKVNYPGFFIFSREHEV